MLKEREREREKERQRERMHNPSVILNPSHPYVGEHRNMID